MHTLSKHIFLHVVEWAKMQFFKNGEMANCFKISSGTRIVKSSFKDINVSSLPHTFIHPFWDGAN